MKTFSISVTWNLACLERLERPAWAEKPSSQRNSRFFTQNDEALGTENGLRRLNVWSRTSKRQMQIKPAASTSATRRAASPEHFTRRRLSDPLKRASAPRETPLNVARRSSAFALLKRLFVSRNERESQTPGARGRLDSIGVCARLFCASEHTQRFHILKLTSIIHILHLGHSMTLQQIINLMFN